MAGDITESGNIKGRVGLKEIRRGVYVEVSSGSADIEMLVEMLSRQRHLQVWNSAENPGWRNEILESSVEAS